MRTGPGLSIELPPHKMLSPDDNREVEELCPGVEKTGIGLGPRSDWESRWPIRHFGRPRLPVAEGSGVRWLL